MKEKKVPMRMCIVCREMKEKKSLFRVVKTQDGIQLDLSGRLAGRGAYVCDSPECVENLAKKKVLNREFKTDVDASVYERIREEILGKK